MMRQKSQNSGSQGQSLRKTTERSTLVPLLKCLPLILQITATLPSAAAAVLALDWRGCLPLLSVKCIHSLWSFSSGNFPFRWSYLFVERSIVSGSIVNGISSRNLLFSYISRVFLQKSLFFLRSSSISWLL